MEQAIVLVSALFFLVIGLVALAKPTIVTRCFGLAQIPLDMGNEVRAVYGGFGLAVAGALLASSYYPLYRPGLILGVAAALLGMAAGRLIGLVIDRRLGRFPALFLCTEILLGGLLLLSLR